MNVEIYCNCHKTGINKLNQIYQKNLMLGSILCSVNEREKYFRDGFLFDDVGENISHLNNRFGQLTGLYWTWKNAHAEFLGNSVYRIFWKEDDLKNRFEKNVLYIPEQIDVNKCFEHISPTNENLYSQFAYCHGETALNFLKEECEFMFDSLKNTKYIHPFNMFIAEKKIFDKVCEILFDIVFRVYEKYKQHGLYEWRALDFLAERILTSIYNNHKYYFDDLKLKILPLTIYKKNTQ